MKFLPINHISRPIQTKTFKPKPFKPYDASKPFISPLKNIKENISQENIKKSIQETSSNSDFDEDVPDSALVEGAPKIIVKNCKNCNIDINVAFNK